MDRRAERKKLQEEKEKEEKIQVMRFSGPRMLLHHPILAIWHLICSKREAKVKNL